MTATYAVTGRIHRQHHCILVRPGGGGGGCGGGGGGDGCDGGDCAWPKLQLC